MQVVHIHACPVIASTERRIFHSSAVLVNHVQSLQARRDEYFIAQQFW